MCWKTANKKILILNHKGLWSLIFDIQWSLLDTCLWNNGEVNLKYIFDFHLFSIKLENKLTETVKDHLFINSLYMSYSIYVILWIQQPVFFSFQGLEQLQKLGAKQSVGVLQLWIAAWQHFSCNQNNFLIKLMFASNHLFFPKLFSLQLPLSSVFLCLSPNIHTYTSTYFFLVYYPVPPRMAQLF